MHLIIDSNFDLDLNFKVIIATTLKISLLRFQLKNFLDLHFSGLNMGLHYDSYNLSNMDYNLIDMDYMPKVLCIMGQVFKMS